MQPKIPSPHRPDSLDATALDHSGLDHAEPWKAARLMFYLDAAPRIPPKLEKAVQLHLVGTTDIAQAAVSKAPTTAQKVSLQVVHIPYVLYTEMVHVLYSEMVLPFTAA